MSATSGKHQKEPNWYQLQLKPTKVISKNNALPLAQSSLTKHQNQFSTTIKVGDFDRLVEPPLLPSLGVKNKKSSRRSADESVEAAVANQLSNLYCDTTSYSPKSRKRPTTSNDLENYSERSPLPADDSLDKSITSKRSPFVLITHINSETTTPEITVRQRSGSLRISTSCSSASSSNYSNSSQNSLNDKYYSAYEMENHRRNLANKRTENKEESYSPSMVNGKKRVGSNSLCQGPITSSIDYQMAKPGPAGRRTNHRRSNQPLQIGNLSLTESNRHPPQQIPREGALEASAGVTNANAAATANDDHTNNQQEGHRSGLEISREGQQPLFGTSNNKTAVFRTQSTKDETSSTKLKGLEVLSTTKDQGAATRRLQPDLMLDEVDEEIGGTLMSGSQSASLGISNGMSGGRRLTCTPQGKVGSLSSSMSGGKSIEMEEAVALKELLLGNARKVYPDGWIGQAFTFQDDISFGLVQKRGGPCGVLAVVQAFILKYLLFTKSPNSNASSDKSSLYKSRDHIDHPTPKPSNQQREHALVQTLSHIIVQAAASSEGPYVVCVPGMKGSIQGLAGRYKADGLTETLVLQKFESADSLNDFIASNVHFFTGDGNSALIAFLCSVMLSRGLTKIKDDMDTDDCPLMGAHGYCSQEMVHLLQVGKATSNTFDGDKVLDDGNFILKGIQRQSDIGLLSLFEHYHSIVVGSFLKAPVYPIWLVCAESHFTVLFATQKGLERTSVAEKRPIDLFFYDQLNRTSMQDSLPIKLTVDCTKIDFCHDTTAKNRSEHLISPIEHCIRTKWNDAQIDWNGTDPLL